MKNFFIWLLSVNILLTNIFGLIAPAYAQSGKETISALVRVFSNLKTIRANLDPSALAEAANYIDYENMSRLAIGDKYWQKLSAAQRKAYLQSYKSLVEKRYYRRWHRIFAKSTIAFNSEENKNGNIFVNSAITTGKSIKYVRWTLTGAVQKPKVINLTVGERDLLKRVQKRFARKLAGAGIPAFIAWVQKKAKEPANENDNGAAEI